MKNEGIVVNNAMDDDATRIIQGLKKSIIEVRKLAECEEDEKFNAELEKVNNKRDLMAIFTSWKDIVVIMYSRKLCDILIENCKEEIKI